MGDLFLEILLWVCYTATPSVGFCDVWDSGQGASDEAAPDALGPSGLPVAGLGATTASSP